MSRNKIRVALTGFGGLDSPEPGMSVARALKTGWDGDIRIDALCYDSWAAGAWACPEIDRIIMLPPLSNGPDEFFRRIEEMHKRASIDVLVPCLELELPVVASIAERLARLGIRTLLPSRESLEKTQKTELASFCHCHGINVPETVHVAQVNKVAQNADQMGYPLMVKGTVADAVRVDNCELAYLEAARLDAKWGNGVLLQRPIEGEEFVVAMMAGGGGELLGSVAMRKLGVNHLGKSVMGAVVTDPALLEHAQNILALLDWRGPIELEFIRGGGGELFLIEINARFPAWIELSHRAECNIPVILLREVLDMPPLEQTTTRSAVIYIRDIAEVVVPLAHIDGLRRHHMSNGVHRPAPKKPRVRNPDGINVAITGISAFDVVMPGVSVAEALRSEDSLGALIGLGYGPYDTSAYKGDLFDHIYKLPDTKDPEDFLERIRTVHARHRLDVVLPCLDVEIPTFIEMAPYLAQMGIRTLLPGEDAYRARAKEHLKAGDQDRGGFSVPETIETETVEDLRRAADRVGFPLAVKGLDSGMSIARSMRDAETIWNRMRMQGNQSLLVQEYVEGEEFAIAAVCDADHQLIADLAIKKIVQCDRGNTWGGVSVGLPQLQHDFARYLHRIGWVGPAEGEFLRDRNSERFYLFEVNPRFPAWIAFSAGTGVSLPMRAIQTALGERHPYAPSIDRMMYLRSSMDVPVSVTDFATLATNGNFSHGQH